MRHLLVIAGDKTEQETISGILAKGGYRFTIVRNEIEALHTLRRDASFDVVLGEFEFATTLEKLVKTYPQLVLVVSSNTKGILSNPSKNIAGVFNYPIEPSSLLAVIQEAFMMSSKIKASEPNLAPELLTSALKVRELSIDLQSVNVRFQNKTMDLTPTEFEILYLLAKNAGRVISLEEIVFQLQHTKTNRDDARKMLSAHMSNLRSKLRQVGAEGYLINVRGRGYLIDVHEALRRSEIQLQLFVEQLPVILWTTDEQLQITSTLGAGLKTIELEPDELVGLTLQEYLQTEDAQHPLIAAHRQALEGAPTALEGEDIRGVHYSIYVEPLVDEQDLIIGCVGIALDVSPRIQAQTALQNTERRLAAIFDNTQELLLLVDAQCRFQDMNTAATQLLGYTRQELLSHTLLDLMPEDSQADAQKLWTELLESGTQRGKWTLKRKDGSLVYVEYRALANVTPGLYLYVMNDITERQLEEDSLQLSEYRYRMVCDLLGDYAYSFKIMPDNSSFLDWVSDGFERTTGYTLDEFRQFNGWQTAAYPDDLELLFHRLKRLLSGQPDVSEFRFVNKQGQTVWVRDSARPVWDEREGRVTAVYGVARIIPPTSSATSLEDQTKDLLSYEISGETISLCAINLAGVFLSMEGQGLNVLGLGRENLVGRSIYEVYREHPALIGDFHRAFLGETFTHTSQIQGRTFSAQYTPIYNPKQEISGVLIVFTYTDLTT